MLKHKIICIGVLLLKISCSLAEQSYVASESWTSSAKICFNETNRNKIAENDMYHTYIKSINFINPPLLPIAFAQSKYLQDGQCKKDVQLFLNELQRGTLWAAQMFDASAKYPYGILYGHTRHLGNFDECYNLQVDIERKDTGTDVINGKYCLVDLLYEKKHTLMTSNKSSMYDFDPNKSVWEAIEEKGNILRIRRYHLQLALCVPSSCKAKDIEITLRKSLQQIDANNDIEIHTSVQSKLCQTAEEKPRFTAPAKIYCMVLLGLLSLIIGSTWYDVKFVNEEKHTSTFQSVIFCFSARRNFISIFKINESPHPELESLYIIRLISSIFVLCVHYGLRYFWTPTINMTYLEEQYMVPIFMPIINGTIVTDIFFTLSGLLLAHDLLKILDHKKQLNFIKNVLSRYLRLTPSYAIHLFFFAWIFPLLNSGPFWKRDVEGQAANCAANWWANLLYIQNYVNPSEPCMYIAWYLSVDFQLFILSHFVIYIFWYMPRKIGYLFLTILTIIGCTISFIATYSYGVSPIFYLTPIMHFALDTSYYHHYIKTHMRFSAYLVGIIAGAILHDHKQRKWQVSKFWSHVLILPLPLIVYIAFIIWLYKIYIPFIDTSILEDAFFAFFYRIIPSLCLSTFIILLSIGDHIECYTSFIKFISPRWVKILSRLTYQVYFVGETIHIFYTGRMRTARVASISDAVWDMVPDAIYAFAFSLVLVVCIEESIRKLTKQIFHS